ncbi:uncharacterized protein LOC144872314 [Branchiostoma floridae x Branchiostoma japonicum]
MADLTAQTVAESSKNVFKRDETRATVPLTKRRKAARQVDSAGYKGDDEDYSAGPHYPLASRMCASRWVCTALTIAIVLVLLIVGGAFVGMYINTSEHDSQKPTKAMDSDHTPGHPDVDSPSTPGQPAVDSPSTPGQPDRCISERIRYTGGQTTTIASTKTQGTVPPPTSNSSQESYVNSKPIVLGGEGTSALLGNLSDPSGVAVSDDEEIFVVEVLNRRVQVFNLNGVSLRVFRTVVPGRDDLVMYPTDVDIDKDGRIWVVGKFSFASGAVQVVQYSKDGLPVATFDVPRKDWFPKIAMNARDNSIIVVASNEILMFKPNGSFDGSFGGKEGAQLEYATTDEDGNILVTDISVSRVHVYDHAGQYSFSFDTVSVGKGAPLGICTDSLGHIIVADSINGRVDMFTSRGEFVHTVVNFTNPWAVAIGPRGQLVVTDAASVATIFPREMVFPDEWA